jgi:hypothetical protein
MSLIHMSSLQPACFACSLWKDISRGNESGKSNWLHIFKFKALKCLLQPVATDFLQAVCQPTEIFGVSPAGLLATQNWTTLANVSFRSFTDVSCPFSDEHLPVHPQ